MARHHLGAVSRLREYVSGAGALIGSSRLPRAVGQRLIEAALCVITRLRA